MDNKFGFSKPNTEADHQHNKTDLKPMRTSEFSTKKIIETLIKFFETPTLFFFMFQCIISSIWGFDHAFFLFGENIFEDLHFFYTIVYFNDVDSFELDKYWFIKYIPVVLFVLRPISQVFNAAFQLSVLFSLFALQPLVSNVHRQSFWKEINPRNFTTPIAITAFYLFIFIKYFGKSDIIKNSIFDSDGFELRFKIYVILLAVLSLHLNVKYFVFFHFLTHLLALFSMTKLPFKKLLTNTLLIATILFCLFLDWTAINDSKEPIERNFVLLVIIFIFFLVISHLLIIIIKLSSTNQNHRIKKNSNNDDDNDDDSDEDNLFGSNNIDERSAEVDESIVCSKTNTRTIRRKKNVTKKDAEIQTMTQTSVSNLDDSPSQIPK